MEFQLFPSRSLKISPKKSKRRVPFSYHGLWGTTSVSRFIANYKGAYCSKLLTCWRPRTRLEPSEICPYPGPMSAVRPKLSPNRDATCRTPENRSRNRGSRSSVLVKSTLNDPPLDVRHPFGDFRFCRVPSNSRHEDLTIHQLKYPHDDADVDINVIFPIERL